MRRRLARWGLQLLTVQAACRTCDRYAIEFSPVDDGEWQVSSPEDQGLDREKVTDLYCAASMLNDIYGLLVVKNGYLIAGSIIAAVTTAPIIKGLIDWGRSKGLAARPDPVQVAPVALSDGDRTYYGGALGFRF